MEDWRTEASSSGRKKGPSGRIWWRLAAAVVEGWEPVVLGKGRDWSWWKPPGSSVGAGGDCRECCHPLGLLAGRVGFATHNSRIRVTKQKAKHTL